MSVIIHNTGKIATGKRLTEEKKIYGSSHSGKSLTCHKLSFTSGKRSAILLSLMPRWTVSQRLRGTLKTLMDGWGHGAKAALVQFSAKRPGGSKISAQNLSYFLNATPGRVNPLGFDDLDDIADFFVVSIPDLFDVKMRELSGEEHRLLFGFRALPDVTRQHFIALLESASVATGFVQFQKRPLRKGKELINSASLSHQIEGGTHGIPAAIVGQLSAVAVQLDQLARHLAQLATHPPGDQPPASGGADESLRR